MDWNRYNEELVRRGEAVFDLDFLRDYKNELKKMNMGKVGRRFRYPESLIVFLATVKYLFHLPYRQLEGFNRFLSRYIDILTPDYTTVHKRVQRLKPSYDDELVYSREPISIAIDASGVKVHKGGGWITRKYGKKKYVKMQLSNYNKWREKFGYGYRWIVETVFSVFKRIFGEYVSAKKFENIVNELIFKARVYNLLVNLTQKM